MRHPSLVTTAFLFAVAVLTFSLPTPTHSREKEGNRVSMAASGFYIQLERCRACSYPDWQKDTVISLKKSGIQPFVSDDITSHRSQERYASLNALPLRRVGREEGWPVPVYVGPITEKQARDVISKLPSILKPALEKFLKENAEMEKVVASVRQLEKCSGNHCEFTGYTINLVRVQSTTDKSEEKAGSQTKTVTCHEYGDALINDIDGKVVTDAELVQYIKVGIKNGNDFGKCVVRVPKKGTHWEPCFIDGDTMYSNQDGKKIEWNRILERRKSGAQHSKWDGDCLLKN